MLEFRSGRIDVHPFDLDYEIGPADDRLAVLEKDIAKRCLYCGGFGRAWGSMEDRGPLWTVEKWLLGLGVLFLLIPFFPYPSPRESRQEPPGPGRQRHRWPDLQL